MNALLVYILEVNFSLIVFYAIYWLVLKNETYHQINRIVILGLILLSFFIPFIDFVQTEAPVFIANLDTIVITAKQSAIQTPIGWNFPSFLSIIYLVGALIALIILSSQLVKVRQISRTGIKQKIGNATLVKNKSIKSPGSFFKKIFWADEILASHQKWIMDHEMVHVNEGHSIDVIAIRLAQVACWFNPAIYLLKLELEATHEFRADKIVSESHTDKVSYSKVLLGQALGVDHSVLAHQFSKPNLLKRRIIMLNKKQNNRRAIARYALLIPTLVFTLAIHACTKESPKDAANNSESAQVDPEKSTKIDGTDIYLKVDQMPEYPGGQAALMNFLGENIKYPESCKDDGMEGTVYVSFVIDEDGTVKDIKAIKSPDERLSASALETVNKMQAWIPGKQDGKNVKVQFNLPIKYQVE